MGSKLIAPATLTPVSLAECKSHCRVDGNDEDALINIYLLSAIKHAEFVCDTAFMPQTWALALDGFPPGRPVVSSFYGGTTSLAPSAIALPKTPLIEVQSVKYDDAQGVEQVLAPNAYAVDSYGPVGRVQPAPDAPWPATRKGANSVRITYIAGFAGQVGIAQLDALRAWILLRVGSLFQHRESLIDGKLLASPFVDHLLDPYCAWQM